MVKKDNNTKQAGFTLIEVAIVVLISGFFFALAVNMYRIQMEDQRRVKTVDNLEAIQFAMDEFFFREGRYPCPADPALSPSDPDYGREMCRANLTDPCPAAVTPSGISCEDAGARDADNDGLADPVMIGSVPFVDLDAIATDSDFVAGQGYDGYGYKISYAVSELMTDQSASFVNPVNSRLGAINLRDGNDNPIVDPESSVHYLVFSHGKTGEGAYTRDGNRVTPCAVSGLTVPGMNPAGVSVELENCDNNDAVFIKEMQAFGAGDSFYDDILFFDINTQDAIWRSSAVAPGTEVHYYNTNSGNVGAGVPNPLAKLDVAGNIRVQAQSRADMGYCDMAGSDCLIPEFLGASTVDGECPDGQVATGIEENKLVCSPVTPVFDASDICGLISGKQSFIHGFDIRPDGTVENVQCKVALP